jgi:hypothetical protein
MAGKRGGMILARSGAGKKFCTKNRQFVRWIKRLLRRGKFTAQAYPAILFAYHPQCDAIGVVLAQLNGLGL